MEQDAVERRKAYYREWCKKNPEKRAEYLRRWRERHPEEAKERDRRKREQEKLSGKRREQQRRYRQKNKEKVAAYNREYRATHQVEHYRGRMRAHLKKKFGITEEIYAKMLVEQFGRCAICHDPCPEDRRLHVDHNHETGQVRSLLCYGCNSGLGSFKDDLGRMKAAVAYLERWQK